MPADLARVVGRALTKHQADRYGSADDLLAELRAVRQNLERRVNPEGISDKLLPSIAVLPFADMSPQKDQDYFCEGMAEELIDALPRLEGLRVVARTSAFRFRGDAPDLREVGEKLNVKTVLEGSVRKAGNRLRINAQLINTQDGYHIWSERYDRDMDDVFAVQDEIARAVVDKLKVKLLGNEEINLTVTGAEQARLACARVVNPEAHTLVLKGSFQLGQKTEHAFRQAIEHYEEAIAIDSTYAPAHAGLAMAYVEMGWWLDLPTEAFLAQARAAALEALKLDSTLAEAHIALARIKHLFEWDWAGAEAAFRRGIALNPSATPALIIYANYLVTMRRFEEAVAIVGRTLERDPLSPLAYIHLGWALDYLGRDAEALEQYQKGLELAPDEPELHLVRTELYTKRGRFDEAFPHAARADSLFGVGGASNQLARLAHVYGRINRLGRARRIMNELERRAERGYVSPLLLRFLDLALDHKEKLLEALEQGYEAHDTMLVYLMLWQFDPLRDDPRFQDLRRKMNFPTTHEPPPTA